MTPETVQVAVVCPECGGFRERRRKCKTCRTAGYVVKFIPAKEAANFQPLAPRTVEKLHPAPGHNRREKRANAKAAQRAYIEDKRRRA